MNMLYEVLYFDSLVFSNLAVKIWFLLLKVLTFEHTQAKRMSCEIYVYNNQGSEEHLYPEMENQLFKKKCRFV